MHHRKSSPSGTAGTVGVLRSEASLIKLQLPPNSFLSASPGLFWRESWARYPHKKMSFTSETEFARGSITSVVIGGCRGASSSYRLIGLDGGQPSSVPPAVKAATSCNKPPQAARPVSSDCTSAPTHRYVTRTPKFLLSSRKSKSKAPRSKTSRQRRPNQRTQRTYDHTNHLPKQPPTATPARKNVRRCDIPFNSRRGCPEPATRGTFPQLTPQPGAPPQISEEEMMQAEAEASFTLQRSLAAAVILYLCAFPPSTAHPPLPWRNSH